MGAIILGGQVTPEDRIRDIAGEEILNIDAASYSYKALIPKYTENILVPEASARTVSIPFTAQEELPKKITLYSKYATRDCLNTAIGNMNGLIVIDIIAIDGGFAVNTFCEIFERENTAKERLMVYRTFPHNSNNLDEIFGYYIDAGGTKVRGAGAGGFVSTSYENNTDNFKAVSIGNFRYTKNNVLFDFSAYEYSAYTIIEFYGFVF